MNNKSTKKSLNTALKAVAIILSGWVIGTILMLGVFSLPKGNIKQNVSASLDTFITEGVFPSVSPLFTSRLDNWTDCLMLNAAFYENGTGLIDEAMSVYHIAANDLDPTANLIAYFTANEEYEFVSFGYIRYWHGYLLILKPLLMLFTYSGIRIINVITALALTAFVMVLMYKRGLKHIILPYFLSVCLMGFIINAFSMQFATMYIIMSLAAITVLLRAESIRNDKSPILLFMVFGMLTSYFDFFTYPLVSLGIPLVIYMLIYEEKTSASSVKRAFKASLFWAVGYGGMWVGKWVIASLITPFNALLNAYIEIKNCSAVGLAASESASVFKALQLNLYAFVKNPVFIVAALLCAYYIVVALKKKIKISPANTIPYLLVCIMPFVWLAVTGNHAYEQWWFTYKDLAVASFAGLSMLSSCARCDKELS